MTDERDAYMRAQEAHHDMIRMRTPQPHLRIQSTTAQAAEIAALKVSNARLRTGLKDALHALTLVTERDGLMDDEMDYEQKARTALNASTAQTDGGGA